MPRTCSVCSHEKREAIDAALRNGALPNRRIAAQHGVSEAAVRRHRAHALAATTRHGEPQTILRAPLRIADERGAILEVVRGKDGTPVLRLYGPDGSLAVALVGRAAGGLAAVYGSEGEPAAIVCAAPTGGKVRCYDAEGNEHTPK